MTTSISVAEWRASKRIQGPYGHVKDGYREDLGIFVRSAWEANYGRYLNWLKARGEIEHWEYEPQTFWFLTIKRGVRSYKPDFRVREKGKDYFVEVKGFMDAKSKTKLKRMKRHYPEIDLRLVDTRQYRSIADKVGRMIPGVGMTLRVIHGDCRDVLRTLPDESVHCCVTSPPYFGLRDYGTASWDGGDPACDHIAAPHSSLRPERSRATSSTFHGSMSTNNSGAAGTPYRDECGKCGARRIDRQIGLESTPDEYVAELVGVFREVRRTLRPDAILWLNLGDSFGARKQLQGIPWRVAFALQADGWILRSDIIWAKKNCMPESITDRPTRSHEYIFMFSKQERYFFDQEAVREGDEVYVRKGTGRPLGGVIGEGRNDREAFAHDITTVGRNIRSVWTVATHSFPDAHFATFPPALIEPCIKAGVPERCCARCGAPWVREVERTLASVKSPASNYGNGAGRNDGGRSWLVGASSVTLGFSPSCACEAGTVPGTVLDPFGGAGTTGLVADRLQRNAVLIELNPEYAAMTKRRLDADAGMFTATELEVA